MKTCFGFQVATEEYQTLYIMNYVRHSENIFLCSGCEGRLPDRARAEVRECEGRTVQERPKTGDERKIGFRKIVATFINSGNHKILTKVISY